MRFHFTYTPDLFHQGNSIIPNQRNNHSCRPTETRFASNRRKHSILRTFALHFCEDCAAFFARLETEFLSTDFQALTTLTSFKIMHSSSIYNKFDSSNE